MRWAARHQTRLHGALGLAAICLLSGPVMADSFPAPLVPTSFDALDGWASDDHAAALAAFTRTCERARVHAPRTRPSGVDGEALRSVCAQLLDNPDQEARTFFEQHFTPYTVNAPGLLTGYFEPQLGPPLSAPRRFSIRFTPVPPISSNCQARPTVLASTMM
jgi:hypothetical protein